MRKQVNEEWEKINNKIIENAKDIVGDALDNSCSILDGSNEIKVKPHPTTTLDKWLNKEKKPGDFFVDENGNTYNYDGPTPQDVTWRAENKGGK